MKRCTLFFAMMLLAVMPILHAQTVQITGKVTSAEDGSPIPGVSVVVKGTTIGTTTDFDGNYTLNAPPAANAIVFSFVGLKTQEVAIGGRTNINVVLEQDVVGLEEVVVTALGISREKKSLGYATQEVKGDQIAPVKSDNFINSLSGKVSGVQIKANNNIGGSTNVVIRGSKSLTGSNQALFVIDGVPVDNSNTNNTGQRTGRSGYDYGNAASDINPNDIESISILKGAAASALYGARAANGVVMITTKKGVRQSQGVGVTLNSNTTFGVYDKSTFPKYQKSYGGGYGPFYSEGDYPGLEEFDADGDGTPDLVVPFYEDASFGQKFDPNLMVYHWDAFVPESPNYKKKTPWVASPNDPGTFFETAVSLTNSIDITGGGEKSTFRLGYTNLDQTGIMPNSHIKRNNIAFNGSYNVTSKLKVSASANYTNTNGKGRNSTGYSDNIMSMFRQWYQVNVDMMQQKELFDKTGQNITWNRKAFDNGIPAYWDNPYWTRYKNFQTDERNRLVGYTQFDYTVNEWLGFMGRVSVDTYNELQEERRAVGSVASELGVGRPDVTSGYSRLTRTYLETNVDLMATFKKDIGDNFNVNGFVGTNIRRQRVDRVFASTNGGLSVPDVYALSNSVDAMLPPEEQLSRIGMNGYFASLSLGYRGFLFLDATYRIDQSSTLPKGNWTYTYPSISGSFLFSEVLGVDWLQLGKLRLNYAEVGNDAPFASVLDTYTAIAPFSGRPLVSVPITKNNPDLKPERTKSVEAGIELSTFQGRLGLDLALYKTNTVNQILPVSVSFATGYSSKYVNAGELENKGVELRLSGTPVKIGKFEWNMMLNWSRNLNEVVALEGDIKNLQIASLQGGVTINARLGEPYGTIQGTDYVYSEDGRRVILPTGYYKISATSDNVIGNVNPDWIGGITNTFIFDNLSFSFLVDMQQGGSIFSLDQWYGMATGLYPETVFTNDLGNSVRDPLVLNVPGDHSQGYAPNSGGLVLNGVLENGNENQRRIPGDDYRAFGYARNPNSAFVFDASYVKLREVVVSYSLPKSLLDNSFVKGASVSFVGSNLWIIHKNLPYADPEASQSSGNIQGWQSGPLPTTRNFGFNIKLQF